VASEPHAYSCSSPHKYHGNAARSSLISSERALRTSMLLCALRFARCWPRQRAACLIWQLIAHRGRSQCVARHPSRRLSMISLRWSLDGSGMHGAEVLHRYALKLTPNEWDDHTDSTNSYLQAQIKTLEVSYLLQPDRSIESRSPFWGTSPCSRRACSLRP
jgi:hypothetical protein